MRYHALRLRRREAVSSHYFGHLYAVRRPASRRLDDLCSLAEILRTDRRWSNHAECPCIVDSIVIEPMNGATRNAYCLSRSDFELFSVDRPGQHPVDAVNGFFVMVVAMGRSRQALRGRDNNFKCRDAAARVFAG